MIQLSGSGLVAPCGGLFMKNIKNSILKYCDTRFKICKSERYWEVMNYLASLKFNACVEVYLQHKVNET